MALAFTTPVGRAVGGDPYKMTQGKDSKTGLPKLKTDGSPMMSSYLALAIPKGDPAWPAFKAMCDGEATKAWPNGQAQHPQFASKIEDGDSTIPNKKGKRNCDREGFPGHWIVKLGSGFAPEVFVWLTAAEATAQQRVAPGTAAIDNWYPSASGEVKIGDYVSVAGSIDSNKSADSPGMYMNLNKIALERVGEAISVGVDAATAFGTRGPGNAAPAASTPTPAATTPPSPTAGGTDAPPPPHTTYMDPPAPPTGPVLAAKANGASYQSFIDKGWTDDTLRQHGYLA